ncbi:hypothetical protein K435DRAFT_801684 [Dendrothele bispora CBS 962.96]|uniref:Uncharacterized protein n=1 Tax=Dendrothele bispora (strain CBS 962.96) TaxID=1314807 RepID=A0A4S8LNN4_DENBC|nr:hypothetical protein K435DRAFT_801684 [Dendrothele bispora CBS 962.96]
MNPRTWLFGRFNDRTVDPRNKVLSDHESRRRAEGSKKTELMLAMNGYPQRLDNKCLSQYHLTSLNKQECVERGAECIEENLHLTQVSISAVPYGPSLFYDPLVSLFIFYGLFSLFTMTSLHIVCFSPPSDCSITTNTLEISQNSSESKDFLSKTGSESKLILALAIYLSSSGNIGESFRGANRNDLRGATINHTGRQIINYGCQCAISSGEGKPCGPCHCVEQQDMTDTKEEEGSRHRIGEVEIQSLRHRRHQSSQETCTAGLPGPEPPPDREDKQPDVNPVRIQPQDGNESHLLHLG